MVKDKRRKSVIGRKKKTNKGGSGEYKYSMTKAWERAWVGGMVELR